MSASDGHSNPPMIVKVAGLGSLTWVRPGEGLRHKALLSTTGFKARNGDLRCYCDEANSAGVVRFNCNRTPQIIYFDDVIGEVYRTEGIKRCGTENRLFLSVPVSGRLPVDCYLVCLDLEASETGLINWRHNQGHQHFCSGPSKLLSASERGHRQQLLALMWPGSFVTTTRGILELSWILAHQKVPTR
jgi:hypothetical protein